MTPNGYTLVDADPWETASNGKAVACNRPGTCTLTTSLDKPAGAYTIAVQYFDLRTGASKFELLLNDKPIAQWTPGDTLTLHGTPNEAEPAPVDYIEITPSKVSAINTGH